MTQHDAFNQGFYDTARQYAGQSPVLSELDAINQRGREYEASKRSAVTTYNEPPPLQARYITPPTNQEVIEYATPGEAAKDFVDGVFGLVVYYAPKVVGGAIVACGVAYAWGIVKGLAIGATATGAAIAAPAVSTGIMAYIGWGGLLLAFLAFCFSGLSGSAGEKKPTGKKRTFYQKQEQGYYEEDTYG